MPNSDSGQSEPRVPKHLAIIMDGNGRWASQRGLPRHFGHRNGVDTVRKIVRAARSHGIEFLTLYSFSSENWSRPEEEVNELFKLLKLFIKRDLAELHRSNVRIRVIGERDTLPIDIKSLLNEAETLTSQNTAQTLVIAFNYGSRNEIISAVKTIAEKARNGTIDPQSISEEVISSHLDTAGIPDPDLILRTAGEIRLSNFLMWQASYSEFAFVDKNWPDFDEQDLNAVLSDYAMRKRKYGGLSEKSEEMGSSIKAAT